MNDVVVGTQRGWPRPHVIVKMGWGSFIGWIATVSHVVVATNLSMRDLPQSARINESLLGVDEVGYCVFGCLLEPPFHTDEPLEAWLVLRGYRR